MSYQNDYFRPERGRAHRKACAPRLELVRSHARGGASLLDLGCDQGYFTFGLAGMYTKVLGMDTCASTQEECLRRRDEHKDEFGHVTFACGGALNVAHDLLPEQHTTILYMSVHHHVIAQEGWEAADACLRQLSEGCSQMFFDMGQKDERCPQHLWHRLLPEMPDPSVWLEGYIRKCTRFSKVSLIGSSPVHKIRRLLWKLEM